MSARTRSRSQEIGQLLRTAILAGRYRAGDRLPSERELADRHEVGRSTVREALRTLEELGLVEIRRGGGASVRPVAEATLNVLPYLVRVEGEVDWALVDQLLDMHDELMVTAVRFCAASATDEERLGIHACLGRLCDRSLSNDRYLAALEELFQRISCASHNLVLRLVRNGIREIVSPEHNRRFQKEMCPARAALEPIVEKLAITIGHHDESAADVAIRELLHTSRARYREFRAGAADAEKPMASRRA